MGSEDNVRISIPENHFLNVTIEALTDLNDEDTGFSYNDFLGFTLLACPYFDTECGTDDGTRSQDSESSGTSVRTRRCPPEQPH